MPCAWSAVAGEGGGLRPPVQLGLGASVLSDHVSGVQKGQVQRCPAWNSLPSRDNRGPGPPLHCGDGGRMTIPCFLSGCRNHLWTQQAEQNLEVIAATSLKGTCGN